MFHYPGLLVQLAILPLDLPCSGPVTHSGEILTTDKSHGKKLDRFSLNDNMDVKKVLWIKYATWNIRGLGEKEEELDKILNENNLKISVITESRKKLQGMKNKYILSNVADCPKNLHGRKQHDVTLSFQAAP